MATVHTEYGPGQIIDRETVRGRTRYKVAGEGFEVWVDHTKLGGVDDDDYDRYNDSADERDGFEEDIHDLRHRLHADDGEEADDSDPGRYSHRMAWAPLDRDNSTTLPYNPDPQYDAIGTPGDDGSSTIQPIHNIDADERLSPADSVTFEEGEDDGEPGPDGDLFARQGSVGKEAVPYWVLMQAYDEIAKRMPQVKEVGDKVEKGIEDAGRAVGINLPEGSGRKIRDSASMGATVGGAAGFADNEATQVVNWASPGGSMGGYGNMIHNSSVHEATPMALVGPALRVLGPAALRSLMGGGDEDSAEGDFGPGEGYGEMIQANYRPAGLSDKYIDITAGADYHNDPVAQFRHDPDAYINRIGHLMDDGLNPRFAEYMDLVEADGGIRTAAWKDVRKKAMRLKREGHVTVKDIAPNRIMASVVGDHGTYDVVILKGASYGGLHEGNPGHAIANWHCGCEWGRWAFRRKYTYVGRLCSHAYASYLTMQSAHMKGKPRQQKGPKRKAPSRNMYFPTRNTRHADALQNGPERLTPEMVVNDADDAHMFVDVTKDERDDVGPDDVVSEQDIVHFARIMAACEANEQPYPRRLVAFLSRYADCTDGGDESKSDWEAQDGSGAGEYLDELRDLADGKQSDDFGSMADRVHAIQHTVEEAREHGTDASQFVASVRRIIAAEGDDEYQTSQDGGRTIYRGPNNTGYAYEDGRYTPVNFTGTGSQGPEGNRYEMGQGSYTRSTENGRDLYRYDGGDGNSGFAVQNGDVRGVNYTGQGEQGSNQRFDYDGSADSELGGFRNFLQTLPPGAPADVPAPGKAGPAAPGKTGPAAGSPAVRNVNSEKPANGGSGGADGSGGSGSGGKAQTSGPVADGGKAGAENGNNAAITKNQLNADGMYITQQGDTLTDIAQRTTGDMNKYQDIANASGITNVDDLAVGTPINLKDFANDVGNKGVSGDVTNPAGGGPDKNMATQDFEVGLTSPSGNTVSTAQGFAATKPQPAQKPADPSKTGNRRRAQAPSSGTGNGGQAEPTGQPPSGSEAAEPATNPATGQPSSAGGAAANPVTSTEPAEMGPDREGDTLDTTDPNQVAQNAQARPGQQPATMPATMGTGMDTGMGSSSAMDFGNVMDMVGTGVGAATDIASGIGSALSGLGSIFASKQDFDDWVRYAYPAGGGDDFDPETLPHIPFNGSGNPGPLEFTTSEVYADEARRGMDDVTDLEQHDVEASMDKWQKQSRVAGSIYEDQHDDERIECPSCGDVLHVKDVEGGDYCPTCREHMSDHEGWEGQDRDSYTDDQDRDSYTVDPKWERKASTDDDSDIVRAFQANLGETALGAGAGGGGGFDDIAGAAQGFLRTAGRNYSLAEQSELIREGDKGGARNLDSLDLTGTHYEDMTTLGW